MGSTLNGVCFSFSYKRDDMNKVLAIVLVCLLSGMAWAGSRKVFLEFTFQGGGPVGFADVNVEIGDLKWKVTTNTSGVGMIEISGRKERNIRVTIEGHGSTKHQPLHDRAYIPKGGKDVHLFFVVAYTAEEEARILEEQRRLEQERLENFKEGLSGYYEDFERKHPNLDTTRNCAKGGEIEDASFPGGQEMMVKYIMDFIHYPEVAIDMEVQGRVYVQFIVQKDGLITDVTVIRGVDSDLDREARRIIKNMPAWLPCTEGNCAVRTRVTLPINFALN